MAIQFDASQLAEARKDAELKDTLFRELNHRIRNNLHVIQGLVRMSRRQARDVDSSFEEVEQRLWAVSEVHNLLYSTGASSTVDFGAYVKTLCNNPSVVPPELEITLTCDVERILVVIDHAVPAALIVLELISNAIKHAFPDGQTGTIKVGVSASDGTAEIQVADNGIGLPSERKRSSGLRLINGLVRQIDATLDFQTDGGTTATLRPAMSKEL